MATSDIREKIITAYKGGQEDWQIAEDLGIDEGFVANVIDAYDQEQRMITT